MPRRQARRRSTATACSPRSVPAGPRPWSRRGDGDAGEAQPQVARRRRRRARPTLSPSAVNVAPSSLTSSAPAAPRTSWSWPAGRVVVEDRRRARARAERTFTGVDSSHRERFRRLRRAVGDDRHLDRLHRGAAGEGQRPGRAWCSPPGRSPFLARSEADQPAPGRRVRQRHREAGHRRAGRCLRRPRPSRSTPSGSPVTSSLMMVPSAGRVARSSRSRGWRAGP